MQVQNQDDSTCYNFESFAQGQKKEGGVESIPGGADFSQQRRMPPLVLLWILQYTNKYLALTCKSITALTLPLRINLLHFMSS